MLKRINILQIIKDHFLTLRRLDSDSKNLYWKDVLLFFIVPILLALYLSYNDYSIKAHIGNLIAATSIFGGFLFNLLAIIYSQIDRIKIDAEKENNTIKRIFVKEIHINISYSIVLSLIIIVSLIGCSTSLPNFQFDWLVKKVALGLTYFLLFNFLLTLLMVLNRVYIY